MRRSFLAVWLAGALAACGDPGAGATDADDGGAPAAPATSRRTGPGSSATARRIDADAAANSAETPDFPARREPALDGTLAGRPARDWIAALRDGPDDAGPDAAAHAAARAALRDGGDAAVEAMLGALAEDPLEGWTRLRATVQDLRDVLVPGLLALLSHDDPLVRDAAFRELRRLSKSGGFGPHDAAVARALLADGLDSDDAAVIASLGPGARDSFDALVAGLRRDDVDADAILVALAGIGPDAAGAAGDVTALAAAGLREQDAAASERQAGADAGADTVEAHWFNTWDETSRGALAALRRMGPRAADRSAPTLLELLRATRVAAAAEDLVATLDALGEADAAADVLVRRAAAPAAQDRYVAAHAFGAFANSLRGTAPPRVVDTLVRLVRDPGGDGQVGFAALLSLLRLATDDRALAALLALAAETGGSDPVAAETRMLVAMPVWDGGDGMKAPPLLDALASADPTIRRAAVVLVRDAPLFPPYDAWAWWHVEQIAAGPAGDLRDAAVAALGPRTPDAPRTLSPRDWASRLGTPVAAERAQALDAMRAAKVGVGEIVPILAEWLRSEQIGWRYAACWAAIGLGPAAAPLLGPLTEILEDGGSQPDLVRVAAEAAGAIGAPALPALTELVRRRGDLPDFDAAFAGLGPGAVTAALATLSHRDADVRAAVVRGLRALGGDAADVVPRVEAMLEDPSPRVRVAAAGTLLALGSRADRAVERLAEALAGELHPDDLEQRDAALELAQAGAAARPALPVLVRALRSDVACATWAACARAVAGIGADAHDAVPALAAGLRGGVVCTSDTCLHRDSIPLAAAEALGAIGPRARAALPLLEAALRDDSAAVRRAAASAIARIE